MKKGEKVYLLYHSLPLNNKLSWHVAEAEVDFISKSKPLISVNIIKGLSDGHLDIEKKIYAHPDDLFETLYEAKINMIKRLIESRHEDKT